MERPNTKKRGAHIQAKSLFLNHLKNVHIKTDNLIGNKVKETGKAPSSNTNTHIVALNVRLKKKLNVEKNIISLNKKEDHSRKSHIRRINKNKGAINWV